MTLNPAFVGLDLGREYWGGLRTPQYAMPGWLLTVNSAGDWEYGSHGVLPSYVDRRLNVDVVATQTVLTIPLADDTVTEVGYSLTHTISDYQELFYHRQGSIRFWRINGSGPINDGMQDVYSVIDATSGDYSSVVDSSGNNLIVQHILDQTTYFAAISNARIWIKETPL